MVFLLSNLSALPHRTTYPLVQYNYQHYTTLPTQSESYMMTVSAAVKLIPSPPALVLSRKTHTSGSSWNSLICGEQLQHVYQPVQQYCYQPVRQYFLSRDHLKRGFAPAEILLFKISQETFCTNKSHPYATILFYCKKAQPDIKPSKLGIWAASDHYCKAKGQMKQYTKLIGKIYLLGI